MPSRTKAPARARQRRRADSGPMTWHQAITDWRSWLTAAGRPPTTVRLRTYQLRRLARDLPDPATITTDQLVGWLASKPWGLETRRSHRAALISFFRWAHTSGRLPDDPAAHLPPVAPAQHLPRPAPEQVIAAAIRDAGPRVRLMLQLAAHQGLRRGEIARVRADDVQDSAGGYTLRVHGKGAKERIIPLSGVLARALRAEGPGFVFPGNDGGHLSPASVGKLMSAALPTGWSAHTLRHRFGTVVYRGSRDLLAVQALLGHSKPETTKRYIELPDDAMRAALNWAA